MCVLRWEYLEERRGMSSMGMANTGEGKQIDRREPERSKGEERWGGSTHVDASKQGWSIKSDAWRECCLASGCVWGGLYRRQHHSLVPWVVSAQSGCGCSDGLAAFSTGSGGNWGGGIGPRLARG
jgi:hypothetical protein